jgi:hypothetical protein
MKDKFFGFYPPEEKEIEQIWQDSIIALDANTLLNLYRYTIKTREDFFKILTDFSDRLWLPFQVGYEFHSGRTNVIKTQEYSYDSLCKSLDEGLLNIIGRIDNYKRHPFIKTDSLILQITEKFNKIKSDLVVQSKKHPEYLKTDQILPKITELFNGKIGEDYSETEYDQIYKEGEKRYELNIPPGFSDKANKKSMDKKNLYGDLILWKQLISYSKKNNKTIIFVTDDRKEDWWYKCKGETICPREELIKEFFNETGFRVMIYQADTFLRIANKRKETIKEKSINEVTEVRMEDERNYFNFLNLENGVYNPDFNTEYQ